MISLYIQVGSLVDSADSKSCKSAKYIFRNIDHAGTGNTNLQRAILVQSTVPLMKMQPVLVYYGLEYMMSAMPQSQQLEEVDEQS